MRNAFAEGYCFKKIFFFFLLGAVFGSFYEGTILLVKNGSFDLRHDLIYGPFSTLYGFATIVYLILLVPHNKERNFIKTFIICFFIGGILEYFVSWFIELLFHLKFWDYSEMILNIQGRTTIPIMGLWGILGTILVKFIYPHVSNWIEKIPLRIGNILFVILFLFLIFDICISYSAFGRMFLRNRGISAKTPIGRLCDEIYDDEFMYAEFPILKGKFKKS